MIKGRREKGQNPYPHKFHVSMSLAEFCGTYSYLTNDQVLEDTTVSVAGKILLI